MSDRSMRNDNPMCYVNEENYLRSGRKWFARSRAYSGHAQSDIIAYSFDEGKGKTIYILAHEIACIVFFDSTNCLKKLIYSVWM